MKSHSVIAFGRLRGGLFGLCVLLGALAAWSAQGATTLIPAGAVWKYLDNGTDQGTAWKAPAFDDSSWNSGPAQLGYGDGDETTVVSYGPNDFNKFVTTYFRHRFDLPAVVAGGSLTLRLLRDDGAIVYVNGVEVFRSNLPFGPVAYNTLTSSSAVGLEETTLFMSASLHPSVLVTGANVVAVEVHQVNPSSTDLSFDLELIAEDGGTNELPVVNVVASSPNAAEGGLASEGLSGAFTFTRAGPLDSTTEVTFILGGSAGNSVDYSLLTNHLTFAPGATEARVLVIPKFDQAVEGIETVTVALAPPACALMVPPPSDCYRVGPQNQATVFIADAPQPPTNRPPDVNFVTPREGDAFVPGSDIQLGVNAPDDGQVVSLEYFANGTKLGDAEGPFTTPLGAWLLLWSNVPPGDFALTAKATDDVGATSISPPLHIRVTPAGQGPTITLVPLGSVWKYWDRGTDQGVSWRHLAYNDDIWFSGLAQFGYGDGDEATVVSFGPDASNKYIVTFFRKLFEIPSTNGIAKLKAHLIQDDGAVVYLNGVEVFRSHLPPGQLPPHTLAIVSVENEEVDFELPPNLLMNGVNLLAVEMHQNSPASADMSFDLSLVAESEPPGNSLPPTVTITAPANGAVFPAQADILIEAVTVDPDGYANKVEFFADDVKIGEQQILFIQAPPPGEPIFFDFRWQHAPVGQYRLTARTRDDSGGVGVSAPVDITVRGATPGDSDNDGVLDERDRCSGTPAGVVVNADGCSIAQLCPCTGPWDSHRAYVRSVVERAWEFYRAGLITAVQRRETIAQAIASNCGRQPGEGDVLLLFKVPQTPPEVRAQGYRYCVIAPAGSDCVIESSTDLRDWQPIETLTLTECETEKVVAPVADSSRFYRARLQP